MIVFAGLSYNINCTFAHSYSFVQNAWIRINARKFRNARVANRKSDVIIHSVYLVFTFDLINNVHNETREYNILSYKRDSGTLIDDAVMLAYNF